MHSVQKGIDDALDSISVSASLVPGSAGVSATVTCDVIVGATVTNPAAGLGSGSSGNNHQPVQPVSGNSISLPDGLPESTAVEPTSSPLVDHVLLPVHAEGHDILPSPIEVYNHASLGSTPSPMKAVHHDASELNSSPEDASMATIIRSTDLDSVNFSKIPSWMCPHLKHFQKHFRGELEDKILGAFVALELAWQPVSVLSFLLQIVCSNMISSTTNGLAPVAALQLSHGG